MAVFLRKDNHLSLTQTLLLFIMSKTQLLTKNFGALTIIQAANFFVPFITLPVIVRIIGPDKFGTLNFLLAVVTYFALFINYGFDYTATRTVAQNADNQQVVNEVFSKVFFAKILLFLISIVFFIVMVVYIPQVKKNIAISVFYFAGVMSNVFLPNWLYQGKQQLPKAAIFNLAIKVISSVIMIIIIRKSSDYGWYAIVTSASQLIVGFLLFAYAFKKFNIQWVRVKMAAIFALLYQDRMVFISTLMISIYTTSNIVILGLMRPDSEVGIYTAASRVVGIVQTLTLMPLSQTLFPHISKSFAQDRETGLQEVKKIFPLISIFTLVLSIVLFLFSPLIIRILFGSAFMDAVVVLRILSFNPFIVSLSNLMGVQTILNLKKDKIFLYITAIGSVVSVVLNIVITHFYNYYGTAVSWVLTELFIVASMTFVLKKDGIVLIDRQYFNATYLLSVYKHLQLLTREKLKLSS